MSWNNSVWVGGLLGALSLATACGGTSESRAHGVAGSAGSAGGTTASASTGEVANGAAGQNTGAPTADPPAGDGGESSDPGPSVDECAGTDACKNTCTAAYAACLSRADGGRPLADGASLVTIDAKITAIVRDAWADPQYEGCVGTPTTDRIHVSLEDAVGTAWELSLSPQQVDEDRYTVGEQLQVDYALASGFAFSRETRLIVRRAEKLDLFVLASGSYNYPQSPLSGIAETDDSGLAFESAAVTCSGAAPSGAACTTEGVAVSAGSTSVSEPCAEDVGDFKVTASHRPRYCAPGSEGFCDALPTFFAAGVRR